MTRLLVSVRSAHEARVAIRAGADLIDVKEPARGSLGPPDLHVVRQVAEHTGQRIPLSVALGELAEMALDLSDDLSGKVRYAKLGLAHCRDLPHWEVRWSDALARFPVNIIPVAVVYADWHSAGAPCPEKVIQRAAQFNCGVVLWDTFGKGAGDLFTWTSLDELQRMIQRVHDCGMLAVLGGSLGPAAIGKAAALSPDYVAVRGAVCRGDRTGDIDAQRVRRLADLLASRPHQPERRLLL